MPQEQRPIVFEAGAGETVRGPAGGPLAFKLRGAASRHALTAFENIITPGDGPPLHTHEREGESWYVLDGTLRFKLGDEIRTAPTGAFVYVPPRTPHRFQSVGETAARILVLFSPAGMETFFDQFAELPPESVEPRVFAELGAGSGMTVLGPPLAVWGPL